MTEGSGDAARRKVSAVKKLMSALVLWALLSAVFPVSLFAAEMTRVLKGMVYCPLTKTLQPIKPSNTPKKSKPFNDLCASRKTKEDIFRELVLKTPWRVFTLDAKGFENLVFDYLAHGKTALKKLPGAPQAPFEHLSKPIMATAAVNLRGEYKIVGHHCAAKFLPSMAARPPTGFKGLFAASNSIRQSAGLSRRAAPRAPPLFSK